MITASYLFSERPNSTFSDQSPFYINEKTSELALIFRLLSGSCVLTNKNSDLPVEAERNYFFSDFRPNEDSSLTFLDSFEEDLSLSDYEAQVSRSIFSNRKFYSALLSELSSSIYHEERDRHTAAFVHIYRAYEHLSYAFPMIYASRTDNYIGTFENLRKWMTSSKSDGNVGELRFHKSFVAALFSGMPEMSSTIDIHITAKSEFKEGIFRSLSRKILGWEKPENYTPLTSFPDKISIQFMEYHSFLVTLRNKFFHYSNGQENNIGMDDVIESDLLFSLINKASLNYIATIFHGLVRHQMQVASST